MKKIFSAALMMVTIGGLFVTAHAQVSQKPSRYGFQLLGQRNVRSLVPPNNLHMQDRRESASNITQEQFNAIVDSVARIWQPIAKSKGVELVYEKKWDDATVNAVAHQEGKVWTVEMYGGLARRPEITPEGFALVVCHETGHHFGGYPFVDFWAADEGQSDYFATQVCLKALWGREFRGNESYRRLQNIPTAVQTSCAQAWPNNANAQGWCVRAAAAGQSVSDLFSTLRKGPRAKFDTPDTNVVPATAHEHPGTQCRLDTYFAGALCTKGWDMNVIPGMGPNGAGSNTPIAETQAMKFSCTEKEGFKIGTRPRCWFKPLL